MSAHARFAPSASERWLTCPGSVPLTEKLLAAKTIPLESDTIYSRTGTAAHWLLNWCLRKRRPPRRFTPPRVKGIPVREILGAVQFAYEYIRALPNANNAALELAVRIDAIGDKGTIDVLLQPVHALATVLDFKNGTGVEVEATENTQLGLYALGVPSALRKGARLVIVQPNVEVQTKEWLASPRWLRQLDGRARAAIADANSAKPTLQPSEAACRYCRAAAHCPARARQLADAVRHDFKDLIVPPKAKPKLPSITALTTAQLSAIHQRAALIRDFLDAVAEALKGSLYSGWKLTDWKLVAGRANRRWKATSGIRTALGKLGLKPDEYEPRELIGLGAMEKLLRAEAGLDAKAIEQFFDRHTVRAAGAPTMVPMSDPREPYHPSDARSDWIDRDGFLAEE